MTVNAQTNKRKNGLNCQRCGGRMASQKYYGGENVYFGWHCIICGDVLDPVILLHRLSRNASIVIPEDEEGIISLIKKYLPRTKNSLDGKTS